MILAGVVCAAFGAWFVLSVLNQFSLDAMRRLKKRDLFSVIPRWTFFAPNPAASDYHLLYRDRMAGGTFTEWRPALARRPKSVAVAVLNPGKRGQKAISDFMRSLNRNVRRPGRSPRGLQLSMPYIALLHYTVHGVAHPADAVETQFAVVQTYGFVPEREPRLVVSSGLHRLR